MENEKTGIYGIECRANGKGYVGSSVGIYTRWSQHRALLRKGRHTSPYLQRAWTFHGEEAFRFFIIEECDKDILEEREQHYLDMLKPAFNCITDIRRRFGAEARAKIAAALRARAALITHCPRGHAYDEVNTYINVKGKRICRACSALRSSGIYAKATPEERERIRERSRQNYIANKADRQAKQKLYTAAHKVELAAYNASPERKAARREYLRRRQASPERHAAHLEKKRQSYHRWRVARFGETNRAETAKKISAALKGRNRRGPNCPYGHPYDAENSLVEKSGKISCRTCRNERKRAKRAALALAPLSMSL